MGGHHLLPSLQLPRLSLPQKAGIQRTGLFGGVLETRVCSEQAVPSSNQTWFSAASVHRGFTNGSQASLQNPRISSAAGLPATGHRQYVWFWSWGRSQSQDHIPGPGRHSGAQNTTSPCSMSNSPTKQEVSQLPENSSVTATSSLTPGPHFPYLQNRTIVIYVLKMSKGLVPVSSVTSEST